jgi:hypothetical protein
MSIQEVSMAAILVTVAMSVFISFNSLQFDFLAAGLISYVTILIRLEIPNHLWHCSELSFVFLGYHSGFCFSVASESNSYCM